MNGMLTAFGLTILVAFVVVVLWSWRVIGQASASVSSQNPFLGRMELLGRRLWARFQPIQGDLWYHWGITAHYRDQALAYLEEAARKGHADAHFELGLFFEEGGLGPGGRELALRYYRAAAELGHAEASYRLGELLRWGGATVRDPKAAQHWYLRSAHRGFAPAMAWLATAFERGEGVAVNPEMAAHWREKFEMQPLTVVMRKSALLAIREPDDSSMVKQLGRLKGAWNAGEEAIGAIPGFSHVAKGSAWFVEIALLVIVAVVMLLPVFFGGIFAIPAIVSLVGLTILHFKLRRNSGYRSRTRRMESAAEQGDPEACYQRGMAFKNGTHEQPRDPIEAKRWLERAAEAGHVEAMVELGDLHSWGMDGRPDPERAKHWLKRAVAAGHAEARVRLARMNPAESEPPPEA